MTSFNQLSLAAYIKKYACLNTKTEDLWIALEEVSGQPVNKLMNSWTSQQGYPVISVKVNGGTLEFDQSQFLTSGAHGDGQWIVPLTLCVGSYESSQSYLLEEKSGWLDMEGVLDSTAADRNSTWVKLNVYQTGFYRVKYDDDLAGRLRHAIQRKELSVADRFGFLDDSFALCMARQLPLTSLLTLMVAYEEEFEFNVLSNLLDMCYKILRIVADAKPELLDSIKIFFIKLFQQSSEKLGWDPKEGESHSEALLRGEILSALAFFGHDATCKEGWRRFQAFVEDKSNPLLPPDIRRSAYVAVMRKTSVSNREDYESLLNIYRETDLSEERARILGSLPSCPDPDIVLEVLNFLLSREVRNQDAVLGLGVCQEGREVAWKWLKDNWEYISETWGTGCLITDFISDIVSPFASIAAAKEVEEFFATRTTANIARTLNQSIERIHINAELVKSIQCENDLENTVAALAQRYCHG
uniref:ERAP1-like C-terminal domain-containing protein n=1 Tax=Kalanchoe fedtschenkoi TaxID=63787 RepID=A0A7N0V590_KALFE